MSDITDQKRHNIIRQRIDLRDKLGHSDGFYSKSVALTQPAEAFQYDTDSHKPFNRNCPPLGSTKASYNHSQTKDAYGGRCVAIEHPTFGREGLFWDAITQPSDFWQDRQGTVIVDLLRLRDPDAKSSYLTSDRFKQTCRTVKLDEYASSLTIGTVDNGPIIHLHYKEWVGGWQLQDDDKEPLFKLARAASSWMDTYRVFVKCQHSVGRTGVFIVLTALFRGFDRGLMTENDIPSELPPLETEDRVTVETDRQCESRAFTEAVHHFTLLREGLIWYEGNKLDGSVPLPTVL